MKDKTLGDGYCGGYTTELEYIDGPALDTFFEGRADLSHYAKLPPKNDYVAIQGTVDMFSWLGTHKLRLKSILGSQDPFPTARGIAGLYDFTYS